MRKALGLVCLGVVLTFALACSQDSASSTPTAPAVASATTSGMQNTFAAAASKVLLCHRNESEDPFGVVVEVKSGDKTHKTHINRDLDCYLACGYVEPGTPCNPEDGADNTCDYCP